MSKVYIKKNKQKYLNNRQTSKINYFILSLLYIANIEDTSRITEGENKHRSP